MIEKQNLRMPERWWWWWWVSVHHVIQLFASRKIRGPNQPPPPPPLFLKVCGNETCSLKAAFVNQVSLPSLLLLIWFPLGSSPGTRETSWSAASRMTGLTALVCQDSREQELPRNKELSLDKVSPHRCLICPRRVFLWVLLGKYG